MTNRAPNRQRLSPHETLAGYYESEPARRAFLTRLFDETAADYDWLSRVVSLGSGAWYRRVALRRAGLRDGMTVLDVATGTGAVAGPARVLAGARGRVIGLDPSLGMLRQARRRLGIPLIQGVAERLPLRADVVDFLSMGFALRHVADLRETFTEYRRVLRSGGVLLVMDFAAPRSARRAWLTRWYLGRVVPWVSRVGAGHAHGLLMQYCWDTVKHAVPTETVFAAIREAGFRDARNAQFGMFSEYVAIKP